VFPSYRVLSSQTTTIAECQWLFNCYLLFGGVESPTQATDDSLFWSNTRLNRQKTPGSQPLHHPISYHSLLSTPYRRRGHVTTRLAIPMRLRAAKRRTTRVFREKNKASHCCEKRLEFRAGLYCKAVTLRLCNIAPVVV
jgi:hypothetical protein